MVQVKVSNLKLNDLLSGHPICKIQQDLRKQQVLGSFSAYFDEKEFNSWHLSLYKFATIAPLKYYRQQTIVETRNFFNRHLNLTIDAFNILGTELSHAIFALLRPGSSWNKEEQLNLNDMNHIFDLESIWHPEYQRYSEHIFNHLISVPLFILGKTKSKDYLSQTLSNKTKLLKDSGLGLLTLGFNSVIRNAISHGAVTYELNEILYSDHIAKVDVRLTGQTFFDKFDNLVDTCHSILIGLLLFLCDNKEYIENKNLAKLPLGLQFTLIDAFASHTEFQLLSVVESIAIGGKNQLNIQCKISSRDALQQLYESVSICWNVLKVGGKKYQRFMISIDCGDAVSSFIILNGIRLNQAIVNNESLEECQTELVETNMLWSKASPIEKRAYKWKSILSPLWEITKKQLGEKLLEQGVIKESPNFVIREIENKSTAKAYSIRRILAHVVIKQDIDQLKDSELQRIVKKAIKQVQSQRVKCIDITKETGTSMRPNYIWIRLYSQNKRLRTLKSFGWEDKDLVLEAEIFTSAKNNGPIFVKDPDLVTDKIRIKFNPNLPEKNLPNE